jgi:hypothetical protein
MKAIEWTFYYTTENGAKHHSFGTGTFIKPERTKIYKELQNLLGKNNVHSIGYIRTALAYLELWNLNKPTNETRTSNSHSN